MGMTDALQFLALAFTRANYALLRSTHARHIRSPCKQRIFRPSRVFVELFAGQDTGSFEGCRYSFASVSP